MGTVYIIILSTGSVYAFSSEEARTSWMQACYEQALAMTGGYLKGVTCQMYWKDAILKDVPVFA